MHHIVKLVILQLRLQLCLIAEVQFYEMDALVLQEVFLAAASDGSPSVEPLTESLFHDE